MKKLRPKQTKWFLLSWCFWNDANDSYTRKTQGKETSNWLSFNHVGKLQAEINDKDKQPRTERATWTAGVRCLATCAAKATMVPAGRRGGVHTCLTHRSHAVLPFTTYCLRRVFVCIRVHTYTHMYMHTFIYTQTHTYTYIFTYTHAYTGTISCNYINMVISHIEMETCTAVFLTLCTCLFVLLSVLFLPKDPFLISKPTL